MRRPLVEDLIKEIVFISSRSSGPGGQNVNKLNTKVSLKFDVHNSELLQEEQKAIILNKLARKINKEGVLIITSQDERSQLKNKEKSLAKLDDLLKQAFFVKRKRKATKPSKAAKQARIKSKKLKGEKKQWRKKPD